MHGATIKIVSKFVTIYFLQIMKFPFLI